MDWVGLAYILAWIGALITGGIALVCLRDPVAGLAYLNHRAEKLPQVMLDRYLAFFGFSVFVAFYRDLNVTAAWAVTLGFMAFADSFIYAREGKPYLKHLGAGIAALIFLAVVLVALNTNGAA